MQSNPIPTHSFWVGVASAARSWLTACPTSAIVTIGLLGLLCPQINAQSTIAGWDFDPLTGGASNFGPSPYAATESADGVIIGGLTRGTGVGSTANSGAGNAWGGNGWDGPTDAASAIAAEKFVSFSITPDTGATVSISSIDAFNVRRSSTGPSTGLLQYQIGAGPFVDIGTEITWGGTTSSTGNPQSAISMSGITELQEVPSGTTITFRIVNFGATSSGGTWYLNDPLGTPGTDFKILGIVSGGGIAPALSVSADPSTFSENAGAEASVGTVTIPEALGTDLLVNLSSSDTSEATVPASVTITAGNTSATFPIAAVNDFLADGNQTSTLTASALDYTTGQTTLTIENDGDISILVSIDPITFSEAAGPEPAATGTVILGEATLVELTVNLISFDTSEATVPASIIIPANESSATFPVTAVDDDEVDGTIEVDIQANITGYTSGRFTVTVTDEGDTAPPPTISVNGIAFTGYNADGNDDLAFVALESIDGGEVILFTDNEWNGSNVGEGGGFNDFNEGLITWTAPGGGVAAGTIVQFNNIFSAGRTASAGTITANNFALAAGGDTVYAFQGSPVQPTRVLAAISTLDADTILGTGLTDYVLLTNGTDIGAYNGGRNTQTSLGAYVALINDGANWVTQDTGGNDGIDEIEPDVPFSSVPFTLSGPAVTYATWAATNANNQTANLDFDGDGIDNGAEYFMGTPGNVFTSNPGIVSNAVTWPRASGTVISSFKVEVSTDLLVWEDATVNYSANLVISSNQVVFTMPTSPTKIFVRLNVVP